MTAKAYHIGDMSVNADETGVTLTARKNRPEINYVVMDDMPAPTNTRPNDPPLSCAPNAAYHAMRIAGAPATPETIRRAKQWTCENQSATNTERFLDCLRTLHTDAVSEKLFYDRRSTTLNDALKQLSDAGFSTGIVSTRTPAHAFVVHTDDDGKVHLIDNGGFRRNISGWQARNVRGLFGVAAKSAPASHTAPPDAPKAKRAHKAAPAIKEAPRGCVRGSHEFVKQTSKRHAHCKVCLGLRCVNKRDVGAHFPGRCTDTGVLDKKTGLVLCGKCKISGKISLRQAAK